MAMSGNEDRIRRGYQAASDALDERPSAATRAAILAAAAREIEAGPRDAAAPIEAPRRYSMRQWPAAAAAAVLLSTLAVMMAVRTEREMPTFTAPTETAESRAPAAPATDAPTATKPAEETPDSKAAGGERVQPPASERSVQRPAVRSEPPAPSAPAAADEQRARDAASSIAERSRKANEASTEQKAEDEADLRGPAAPLAPAAPAPLAKADSASAEAMASTDSRRKERGDEANLSRAPMRQAPVEAGALGAAAGAPSVEADAASSSESSADKWLERIVKLRSSGRHDEADVELKRFRERYPHIQVPPSALPPSGTR
jgi:hypothetical protein